MSSAFIPVACALAGLPDADPNREVLTLDRAVALARKQTSEVIQARTDVLLVDVERAKALSSILPRVDLTLTAAEDLWGTFINEARYPVILPTAPDSFLDRPVADTIIGPFQDVRLQNNSAPMFRATLSGRQLIYDGGKWWTTIERVDDIESTRRDLLAQLESNAQLNAVRGFYNFAKTLESVLAVEEQVRLTAAQLESAQARLQAGRAKKNDVAIAERNLASDQVTLTRRRLAASQAKRALNIALGRDPETSFLLQLPEEVASSTASMQKPDVPPLENLAKIALASRPEVSRFNGNLELLKKNVDLREGDYWPVVSLTANYWRGPSRRPDRIFNDPTENYHAQVGLEVRWNLYNGGATSAAVEEAEMQLTKQQAAIEDLARDILREVGDIRDRLELFYEVYRLARNEARAAEESLRLAQGLHKQGKYTTLELRDAELGMTNAGLKVVSARYDIEIAKDELRRALGVSTFEEAISP